MVINQSIGKCFGCSGNDVKRSFVAHLYAALSRAGFIPFLDAKCIQKGSQGSKSIDEALSGARVHVAVLSKSDAESKYCLNELLDMLQSKKPILPVFYDVRPGDLRPTENGPFAEGFQRHLKRRRHDEILKWKEALRKVADIDGYEANGRDEDELILDIVGAIRNAMPVNLQPQKLRFGLEGSKKDVVNRLERMKDSVNVLGLVGTGGIGKTTLASEIYNDFVSRGQFQYHCFLKDVRSSGVFPLRRQLIRDLIQEDLHSSSSEEYRPKFDSICRQRVLLIVDDIDKESQFANLILDMKQLCSGS